MSRAALIVCESAPRWTVLLRRFAGGVSIREGRSLALAGDMLVDSPHSFVAVDGAIAAGPDVLSALAAWRERFPQVGAAVFVSPALRPYDAVFREAGAQLIVAGFGDLPLLVRMVRRHLARLPQPAHDWRESLLARLPWSG